MKKIRNRLLIIMVIFSVLLAPVLQAAVTEDIPLNSGARLLLTKTPGQELVAIYAFFNLGPLYEKSAEAGISNLTLRALVRGTEKHSYREIIDNLESTGGSIETGCEENTGYLKIIVQKKYFSLASEILAEILTRPVFLPAEISRVKDEIISEINSAADQPEEAVFRNFYEEFYAGTPYFWPPAGQLATVNNISRPQILKFYRKYITASNCLLSITGDFDRGPVETELNRRLADFRRGEKASFNFPRQKPQFPGQIKIIKNDRLKTSWVLLGYRAPAVSASATPVFKIISTILGGGLNSRLFTRFREDQQLAYAVGANHPLMIGRSHLVAFVQTSSAQYSEISRSIGNIVENLKITPVADRELERAKNYFSGLYLAALEKNSELAYFKGKFQLLGLGVDFCESFPDKIKKVTAADIQKYARNYLNQPLKLVITGKE